MKVLIVRNSHKNLLTGIVAVFFFPHKDLTSSRLFVCLLTGNVNM